MKLPPVNTVIADIYTETVNEFPALHPIKQGRWVFNFLTWRNVIRKTIYKARFNLWFIFSWAATKRKKRINP